MSASYSLNPNISAASVSQNNHGLLEVVFSCRGNIEYPTALADGKSLFDEPIYAFKLGEQTSKRMPSYSYTKYQQAQKQFDCVSILYRDGSAYKPSEEERNITSHDKLRIYNAYSNIDQFGLRHVFFEGVGLIGNKPIYPTAIAEGKSLDENALDAFWGGAAGINMPAVFTGYDDAEGWFWRTETVLNGDGTAIANDGELILSYNDYANYTIPGGAGVDSSNGFKVYPATNTTIKVKVNLYLIKDDANVFEGEVLRVKQWAGGEYRATVDDEHGSGLIAASRAFNGCLATTTNIAGNLTFMGREAIAVAGTCGSNPTSSAWWNDFKIGAIIARNVNFIFADKNGVSYMLGKEIVLDENF